MIQKAVRRFSEKISSSKTWSTITIHRALGSTEFQTKRVGRARRPIPDIG
jgi:hypothetical protein